jgi:hypothetical protein
MLPSTVQYCTERKLGDKRVLPLLEGQIGADVPYSCVSACNFDPLSWGIGVRPSDWTVSCGDFDSLPGVVILELRRA